MATKGIIFYLLSGFSAALILAFIVDNNNRKKTNILYDSPFLSANGLPSNEKNWPSLKFGWRIMVASVIGFLGSGFGTVGGVGGGGIFVPMLTLVIGFDTKSAAALSKCMIMAASAASVWYNLRVQHPEKDIPILDYDLALLFQPMLLLGITIGVSLSVVFPYWLITILIIILFIGTSSMSFNRGIAMWKEETLLKNAMEQQETMVNSRGELLIDTNYQLLNREEKSAMQTMRDNLKWKRLLLLGTVWVSFLLLQILKNDATVCGTWYWILNAIQVPIAFGVFGLEAVKLNRESKKRKEVGNRESVCGASIEWTPLHLGLCAACGLLGGTVGGLLGSGGGFILGPLLLEIGVIPQVASATATFVMFFSASLSVVEFYFLKRFPIPYALYLMTVSMMAGFWGQFFVRKLVTFLKRASLIVFILSSVIFTSAITMGVIGIRKSIIMIQNHDFMGFLGYCSNQ